MQAAEGEGGGGSGATQQLSSRAAASADEQKLIDVLLAAPSDARLVTLLQHVTAWQCEGLANLQTWSRVLERLDLVLQHARTTCPRIILIADATPTNTNSSSTDAPAVSADAERELTVQVYEVLRFMALLLQNAMNKRMFKSIEVRSLAYGAIGPCQLSERDHHSLSFMLCLGRA